MKLLLWEIWSYAQVPVVAGLFYLLAKRNVLGHVAAGMLVGAFIEFSTEPLWNYHFRLTFYKDIPPGVILGWGAMFALVVFVSEKLYCWALHRKAVDPRDKRIFFFDALTGFLVGFPLETVGLKAGVWSYRQELLEWNWGLVPWFNMPLEALFGYCLLMLMAPTFVRHWSLVFEGRPILRVRSAR